MRFMLVLVALSAGCTQLLGLDDPRLNAGRDGGLGDAGMDGTPSDAQSDAYSDGSVPSDADKEVVVTPTAFVSDPQNASTYPFANVAIGDAAANRHIVVLAHGRSGTASPFTNAALTMDGVAMTRVVTTVDGQNAAVTALFIAPRPSGTTANFVLSYTGGDQDRRVALGVWAVYGLTSMTPTDTAVFAALDPGVIQLDLVDGGVAFAGVSMSTVPAGTTGQWNTGTTYGQIVDASWFAGTMTSSPTVMTRQLEHDSSDPTTTQLIVGASFR